MNKKEYKHKYNPANERMKYQYAKHIRRTKQRDEKTVLSALKHIRDFEIFIKFSGFEKFNDQIADKYVQYILSLNLSKSYISDNIRALKEFLKWLERQNGYRSKINYNHIDYLNISTNQQKEAKAMDYQPSYTFEQIIKTIRHMPNSTDKEKRDKAIISLNALCGLRVSELRTIKIKNLIQENGGYFLHISPKNMQVKFAKTRTVHFMPLPEDIIINVIAWRDYLKTLEFKNNDPLFPVIDNRFTETNLLCQTMRKEEIKSDTTIRNIFKKAFETAGFAYIKPHSFRNTMARDAQYQSPAFLNAVRQNLGHNSIDTTLNSYGQLSVAEQGRVISSANLNTDDTV